MDRFFSLCTSTIEDVVADLEPHGLSGAVCSQGKGQDTLLTVAAEATLVDNPMTTVPLSEVCKDSIR